MSFHITLGPSNLLPSEWVTPIGIKLELTPRDLVISDGLVFVLLNNEQSIPIGVAIDLAQDLNMLFVTESL